MNNPEPGLDDGYPCSQCGEMITQCGETPAMCCFNCDHGSAAAAIGQALIERDAALTLVNQLRAALEDTVEYLRRQSPDEVQDAVIEHLRAVLDDSGGAPPCLSQGAERNTNPKSPTRSDPPSPVVRERISGPWQEPRSRRGDAR